MMTRFVGPAAAQYQFAIVESPALRVRVPEALCVLK
jgi:hypothetical protein